MFPANTTTSSAESKKTGHGTLGLSGFAAFGRPDSNPYGYGSFHNQFKPFESAFRQPNDSRGTPAPPLSERKDGGVAYNSTSIDELDWRGKKCVGKMISISGMPVYNLKSHEELRWEDKDLCRVTGSMPPPPPPTTFLPPAFSSGNKESSSPVYGSSFSILSTITGSSTSSVISNSFSPLSSFFSPPAKVSGTFAGFDLIQATTKTKDPSRLDLSSGFEDLTGNEVKSNIFLDQKNINQEQQLVTESNANPFGILPIVHYGISTIPVRQTHASPKISSYLSPHRLSQSRRTKFAVRKYDPKCDRPKVAFFADDEGIARPDVYLIPRENPRALLMRK
ncbi:nuclear pore complex protein NUP98A-like [Impatiens glandulifera]|uniref:nuclear pore complex protein NUP98A-like n=1 Tax=Impatiens glandulifera TaxID=253017 RepID=UPI001FB08C28|nr:nuclear pore complex protein NUP98A-like [Impatiens glandulifera]